MATIDLSDSPPTAVPKAIGEAFRHYEDMARAYLTGGVPYIDMLEAQWAVNYAINTAIFEAKDARDTEIAQLKAALAAARLDFKRKAGGANGDD